MFDELVDGGFVGGGCTSQGWRIAALCGSVSSAMPVRGEAAENGALPRAREPKIFSSAIPYLSQMAANLALSIFTPRVISTGPRLS